MTLGETVRTLRQQRGMTQKQLAGECITRNMLSQIENDQAIPSVKTLEHLAQMLEVSVSYLLDDSGEGELAAAKKALRRGHAEKALALALPARPDGDEKARLLAEIYSRLSEEAFQRGDLLAARRAAASVLDCEAQTLYRSSELRIKALELQVRCDLAEGVPAEDALHRYRACYDAVGWEEDHHFLCASYHMTVGDMVAAEREIWSVTELTEKGRPIYLLLRGRLALMQEKYNSAISYLKQAEALDFPTVTLRRELYRLLELAYKELEDYRAAYEYADKQRKM